MIDADQVGHQVLELGGEVFDRVAETWPSVVVNGVIDRRKLADIVFDDPAELRRLEEFTHSAIREQIADVIRRSSEQVVVVEVPLLTDFMGTGWIRVVVDADPGARLERLRGRGVDEDDATRRVAAQPERARWVAAADEVIDNSRDPEALEAQVDALWMKLTSRS